MEVIADDILVYGCGTTDEECQRDHDTNLDHLLQRARDKNSKFNRQKLRLYLPEVTYMGHCLIHPRSRQYRKCHDQIAKSK